MKLLFTLFCFIGLFSCQQQSVQSDANSQNVHASDSNKNKNNKDLSSIFHDNPNFSIDDIKNGSVCKSVIEGRVTFNYFSWPNELKTFLSNELDQFPIMSKINSHLEGIYLVNFNWVSEDMDIGGYTCQNGSNKKYVVFLNKKYLVDQRSTLSEFDRTSYDDIDGGITLAKGDYGLATLIHELFHVLDLAIYLEADDELGDLRGAFYNLSWDTPSKHIFSETSSVNSSPIESFLTKSALQKEQKSTNIKEVASTFLRDTEYHLIKSPSKNFHLFEEDYSGVIDFYNYLRNTTNFVVPDADANFLEDFAETLESYYMTTRYKSPSHHLTIKDTNGGSIKYEYSDSTIANESTAHLKKYCFLVEEVFEEKCRLN